MVSEKDFLVGVKLSDSPRNSNVWDWMKKIEKKGMCLNCERHRWKKKELKLCEKCYRLCSREKCIHCKEEFSNHKFCEKARNTYKRPVCLNCARNIATYNTDPKLCRFCSCWSAWRESSECDRCFKSLEKFGNPSNCESCNKNCAFDRGEESRNKVSGLKLCFLCTYDFKKNDYYNKRRLNLNHHPSDSDPNTNPKPSSSSDPKYPLSSPLDGTNPQLLESKNSSKSASDPEKQFLLNRIAELEAELSSLRESYKALQDKLNGS